MDGANNTITVGAWYWIRFEGQWLNVRVFAANADKWTAYFHHEGRDYGALFSEFHVERPRVN